MVVYKESSVLVYIHRTHTHTYTVSLSSFLHGLPLLVSKGQAKVVNKDCTVLLYIARTHPHTLFLVGEEETSESRK